MDGEGMAALLTEAEMGRDSQAVPWVSSESTSDHINIRLASEGSVDKCFRME